MDAAGTDGGERQTDELTRPISVETAVPEKDPLPASDDGHRWN